MTDKDVAIFHLSHNMVTALRKFVVTEQGYIGWAPESAQRGDSIVLLSGGKLPYVLRPVSKRFVRAGRVETIGHRGAKHPDSRIFAFIGDAYIQGMMEGELYDPSKLEDFHLV